MDMFRTACHVLGYPAPTGSPTAIPPRAGEHLCRPVQGSTVNGPFTTIKDEAVRTYLRKVWTMPTDPLTEDPRVLEDRADDEAREQRWAEFVLDCYRWGVERTLFCATAIVSAKCDYGAADLDPDNRLEKIVRNFAETEGWPGVLTAIARAMREAEAEAAEVERRR